MATNEIKKKKMTIKDPIKRIGLNGGNGAREIVIQIATALNFKIHEDEKGVSAYGGNAIRLADHCTYMQTWVDNGTWNAPVRLDIVIEDKPTQAVTQVKVGYDFNITEYVYNSSILDPQKARLIAYDIKNAMNGNQYANNIRGDKRNLIATHGNNRLNCNLNMNKKLIKLTESDLHRIVKESVKRILRETAYDINSPKYKQMYDSGNRWPDETDDAVITNREISDYEALPDRARHPYGQDFPDFSDRIANRAPVVSKDKLASKKPNSVLDMQNNKRKLNGLDPATAEHIRRNKEKEENDMIKYGYTGYH